MKINLTLRYDKKIKTLMIFSLVLFSFLITENGYSNVTVTAPSASLTTCIFPTSYTSLGDIVITENSNGDFAVGANVTLILTAPANFEFNPGVGLVTFLNAKNITAASIVVTVSTITVTYTVGGTNRGDKLTIADIEVRGITAPSAGNILRTAGSPGTGTIAGITNGTTSFCSLTSAYTASAVTISKGQALNMCLNVPTTLSSITVSEGTCTSDFSVGNNQTIIITAPTNFTFVNSGTATATYSVGNDITASSIAWTNATTMTITLSVGSNVNADALIISGIQVQSTIVTALSNITRTGGTATIAGLPTATAVGQVSSASSTVTLTTAGGASCLTINGAYSTLSDLVIDENCGGDISSTGSRTFTITIPATFEFDLTTPPTVTYTAGGNITSASLTLTATVITVTLNVGATTLIDEFRVVGIRVRAKTGTANGTTANMTSGGTAVISGVPAATVLGTLTANASAGTITWTGAISTAWALATNWLPAAIPTACSDVVIPNVINKPIIGAATSVNSVLVQTGAQLTANAALTINSTFTIQGTGTYIHNNTGSPGSTIFAGTESFSTTSTIQVLNWISAAEPFAKFISGSLGNVTLSPAGYTAWDQQGYMSGSSQKVFGTLTITVGQVSMDGGAGASSTLKLADVVTSGTGAIIVRSGAAPGGGVFNLTTGNVTLGGTKTAYSGILYQCPANTLNWTCTGNFSCAQDFGASQGSAGAAVDINMTVTGNLTITTSGFEINESAYLGSDVNLTVNGTTFFSCPPGTGNFIVFIDGGSGNLNFTTGNWVINNSPSAAPYNALMTYINYGQSRPTGSVTVNVTSNMQITGANRIYYNYLVNETTNASACALTVGGILTIDNSYYLGGFFPAVSEIRFANHNGSLSMTAGTIDFKGRSQGYINIYGQYNSACASPVTITTTGDFIVNKNALETSTSGAGVWMSESSGYFTMNIGGAMNINDGYFRGTRNTSSLTCDGASLTANSLYWGGTSHFLFYYACNSGTGAAQKAVVWNIANNMDLRCNVDGNQFWILGLAALTSGATTYYSTQTFNLNVGGNLIQRSSGAGIDQQFVTSNTRGLETIIITGDMTISSGDNHFNVVIIPAAASLYGHNTIMTIGGNLTVTGGDTYLSTEKGTLTATVNGDVSIATGDLSLKAGAGTIAGFVTANTATLDVLGGYSQTSGNFIFYNNTVTPAPVATDVIAVTINSNDDATGDFSQTGGTLNFDGRIADVNTNTLTIKSPNYTLGGAGVITRAATAIAATAAATSTTVFGELYFSHSAGITYLNSAVSSTTHFIQNVKQYINSGTAVNASGSTNPFQISSNSVQNNISGANTNWALNVNGTLNMGTKIITAQGPSLTAYFSGFRVNTGGSLQTGNANGFYNGINASATLEPQVFSGNISFNMDFNLDANSAVEYNGSVNQIVTGKYPNVGTAVADVASATAAQYHYGILNINHQAALSATAFVYPVASNVFVRTRLDLTNGQFRLTDPAAPPTIGYTVTVETGTTGAITSTTTGYLRSELNASNNTAKLQWNIGATTGAHIYPFGEYNGGVVKLPVTFNNSGASGNVSASTRKTATSSNLPFSAVSNVAAVANMNSMYSPCLGTDCADETVIDRWWDFTSSAASPLPAVAVTFTYQGIENTLTNAALRTGIIAAQHWNGTTWEAPVSTGVSGVTTGTSSVTANGLTKFSPYILSSLAAPLPIELLSFNATLNGDKVDLKWATATETNNDYFTVEKSKDGQNFVEVLIQDGAGNSTTKINYSNVDLNPFSGVSYYRLKQTDFNGQYTYSNIVPVKYNLEGNPNVSIYPNPSDAGATTYLSLEDFKGQEVLVVLRDITGRELFSKKVTSNSRNELISIDEEGTLAKGSYLVSVTSADKFFSKKLIIK